MTINRAWHLRQFVYALIPPAAALIMLESVRRWGEGRPEKVPRDASGSPALSSSEKKQATDESESTAIKAFKLAISLVDSVKAKNQALRGKDQQDPNVGEDQKGSIRK